MLAAVRHTERSAGMAGILGKAPRFARAKREAPKVELVAGRVAADRRVECRQVVEREIAVACEEDFLPARNGAGNPRISTGNGQAVRHGAARRDRQGAAAMDRVGVARASGGDDLAAIDLADSPRQPPEKTSSVPPFEIVVPEVTP